MVQNSTDISSYIESINTMRSFAKSYKSLEYRISALKKLKNTLQQYETHILDALQKDLHKHPSESFLTEILQVYEELEFMIAHLPKLIHPQKVKTPLSHFGSKSFIYPQSYGLILIISPWNYPLNLSLIPLIGAIAGGNCAVLKPSEYSPHTSKLIAQIIAHTFESHFVQVILGDSDVGAALLEQKFDFIFFTGSVRVGKIVMQKAAAHLTPIVLELGGKNPCIVSKNANITQAAKKIVWAKFLNAGQTCIAPDYILVQEEVLESFIQASLSYITTFFGKNPKENANFGRIISPRHFERIAKMMQTSKESATLLCGGELDSKHLYVAPTFFKLTQECSHPLMQEEIFAPIAPIIPFKELSECLEFSRQFPKPLASYIFTQNHREKEFFLQHFSFGNGCINDCIMQVANPYLPFGGIGTSGMGSYHGIQSFKTFTHQKSIVENHFELPLRYPPFKEKICGLNFMNLLRFILRI